MSGDAREPGCAETKDPFYVRRHSQQPQFGRPAIRPRPEGAGCPWQSASDGSHVTRPSSRRPEHGFERRPRGSRLASALVIAVLAPTLGSRPSAVTHSGSWGNALEMPGSVGLNYGVVRLGSSEVPSVNAISCPSADNCSAGGEYTDRAGHGQAFLVDDVGGQWESAIEVPGSAALNAGGHAEINSVSCASAGNCAAGGDFATGSGGVEAMVVDEVGGVWAAGHRSAWDRGPELPR